MFYIQGEVISDQFRKNSQIILKIFSEGVLNKNRKKECLTTFGKCPTVQVYKHKNTNKDSPKKV